MVESLILKYGKIFRLPATKVASGARVTGRGRWGADSFLLTEKQAAVK